MTNKVILTVLCVFLTFSTSVYAQESPAFKAKYNMSSNADLRIIANNIWEYSEETIPEKWQELGEDPRDFVRAPQLCIIWCEVFYSAVLRATDQSNGIFKLPLPIPSLISGLRSP